MFPTKVFKTKYTKAEKTKWKKEGHSKPLKDKWIVKSGRYDPIYGSFNTKREAIKFKKIVKTWR